MTAVGAAHWYLPCFPGCLNGLEGAKSHLVVIRSDAINLLSGRKPVLHNGFTLLTLPVSGFFADDFDVRKILLSYLLDSIGAADRSLVTQLTHQNYEIAFAAHRFAELFHVHDAGFDRIGSAI